MGNQGPKGGQVVGFRPDIDGLRAVAIVLVVAYHARVPGFGGGFIGVDVFFVISGYLISRQLLDESRRTGTVRLLEFWGRRIRRLVPALATMVVVTVGVAWVVLPALDLARVTADARRSLLYVSNVSFARQAGDYFASDLDPSLFLHTWSLGIEEQFYILWPLLVLVGAAVAGRVWPQRQRRVLGGWFAALALGSFAWCFVLTRRDPAGAFYLLPSRAWEFALAGLLVCLPVARWSLRGLRVALELGGVLAIVVSAVALGRVAGYPGAWPLLPVLGTAALIAAGAPVGDQSTPPSVLSSLLGHASMQWIGRLSYSWYLWHWPLLVLGARAFDDDGPWLRAALVAASLGVAWLAHVAVENPIRFKTAHRSGAMTYAMASAVTVLALVAVGGVGVAADREVRQGPLAGLADVREQRRQFTCAREATTPSGIEYCEDGDLGSDRTVLLVGDSHARHWKPAFAAAAKRDGIRLLVRWRPACPSIDVSTYKVGGGGRDVACDDFRADTGRLVDVLSPDVVVRADSHQYTPLIISPDDRRGPELWSEQLQRATVDLHRAGIATGIVADSPVLPFDPVDCLAENGEGPSCQVSRSTGYERKEPLLTAERRVEAKLPYLRVFDITATLCPDDCPLVIDRTYVYSDKDHLTEPFVLTQVDEVRAYLARLLT